MLKLTKLTIGIFALSVALWAPAHAQDVQTNPIVIYDTDHDTSPPLAQMPGNVTAQSVVPAQSLPVRRGSEKAGAALEPDPVTQELSGPLVSAVIGLNFDGVSNLDGVAPPDPNASVGDTQVVETVNDHYQVFSKTTGTSVLGPNTLQSIWSGFNGGTGSICGKTTVNYSDPVVLYDKAAARWVISLIAYNNSFTTTSACYAVSASSDATGSYNRYELVFGANLPDYQKLGVWPDAYYASYNIFPLGGAFTGAEVCALNRAEMLAGAAVTVECFMRTTADFSFLPSDADGATQPVAGQPAYYLELASATSLNLYTFQTDFVVPATVSFTGPVSIPVASYTQACASTGTCIPQSSTTQKLDSLGDRLMHRLAWRNFNGVEHLVVTHSVKPNGTGVSGVRWYDIVNPATVPTVAQQGTVTSGRLSLWMGSIAMDKVGDFALGFSRSSSSAHPSIVFTGRVPTDAVNTMESLAVIKSGAGSQTNNRWGDYTSMSIDPIDDCTFWYTNEYLATTGSSWHTRIASLKFPGCS